LIIFFEKVDSKLNNSNSNLPELENVSNDVSNLPTYLKDFYVENKDNPDILSSIQDFVNNTIQDEEKNFQAENQNEKRVSFATQEQIQTKLIDNMPTQSFLEAITGGIFSKTTQGFSSVKNKLRKRKETGDTTQICQIEGNFKDVTEDATKFQEKKTNDCSNIDNFDELFERNNCSYSTKMAFYDKESEKNNKEGGIAKSEENFDVIKLGEKTKQESFEYAKPEDIKFSPYPKRDLFTGKEMTITPHIQKISESEPKYFEKEEIEEMSRTKELEYFENFDLTIQKERNKFDNVTELTNIQDILIPDRLNDYMGQKEITYNAESNEYGTAVKTIVNRENLSKFDTNRVKSRHEKDFDDKMKINIEKQNLKETKAWIHNSLMGTLGVCMILYLQSLELIASNM